MHEKKKGTLKSGSRKKVTSRKQAIAIGLSQARKEGGKVPEKNLRPNPGASGDQKRSNDTCSKVFNY
ncbi:MAG: DUF6496 domain-containing protein [Chitinophagales bacterium]